MNYKRVERLYRQDTLTGTSPSAQKSALGRSATVVSTIANAAMLTERSTAVIRCALAITQEQFVLFVHSRPVPRGKVAISHRQVRSAFFYVVAHGDKWRGLPQRFGNWHTIAISISRWTKVGVRDRLVAAFQQARILHLRSDAISLDATDITVHPDGSEAL